MAGPSIPLGRIDGYEVQGKLGAGGMGIVYKALDVRLNRTVALKFLSAEDVAEDDRDRLLREARAASALDHPNIAAVHTIEETSDGRTFIVMGYYEGETLAEKVRRGPLQSAHAVNIALQIARGLQHAHTRNITHRDIKPSNVLITNEGVAKILDFGLARIHNLSASTESAVVSGTLLYMSPEQAQGRPLDQRSDIWAFGILLYQMVTGKLPFWTDNVASTILAILNAPPPAMIGVAEDLQLIVLRALSKTPDARYQSCAELIRDLEKVAVDDHALTVTLDRGELQKQLRSATQSATTLPMRPPRRVLWIAITLCLAVGFALALLVVPVRKLLFGPEQKHIAVLPFEVNSKDPAVQSLADGLMESITGKLSNLSAGGKSLWVVPADQVRRRKIDAPEAARKELGATVVLEGKVQQSGHDTRLTVTLVDTTTMRLLGSVDIPTTDDKLAALEDEIVSRLAMLLDVKNSPTSSGGAVTGAAYEYYLQGRGLLLRFDVGNNLDNAIAQFEKAIAADPAFALAHNGLAEAYWNKSRLEQNPEFIGKAEDEGKRALQLNEQLPAVYITLGNIHDSSGKHELALDEFQHALNLEPNNADALLGLGRVYEHIGQFAKAEETFRRGATLRPDYWGGWHELGNFYFRQHRYEDAAREWKHVLELAPDSAPAHANYATALNRLGPTHFADAEAELKKAIALKPNYIWFNQLGNVYWYQRRWSDAANMYDLASKMRPDDYRIWGNLGLVYGWLGEQDKAMASYRRARDLEEKAILLNPDDPEMHAGLGLLYARDHIRDKSVPHLEAALARTANDTTVLVDAAEAYLLLGDRAQAVALLKRAFAAGMKRDDLDRNQTLRGLAAEMTGPEK